MVVLRWLASVACVLALLAAPVVASPTAYEQPDTELQLRGYDAQRNVFVPIPAYYDGELGYHYWFRTYTPESYPVSPNPFPEAFPPIPIFYPSTDGALTGVPEGQRPIITMPHFNETGAGNEYATDIVKIMFVRVEKSYVANTHKSMQAIWDAGYDHIYETDMYANMPEVPVGSRLLDPHPDREFSPIQPEMAWRDGQEAQMFAFESTSKTFQSWINARTRSGEFQEDLGYRVAFTPRVVDIHSTLIAPMYYFNQYPGDGLLGGPNPQGQRNVFSGARNDLGYSAIHQVLWLSRLPVGYQPNSIHDETPLYESDAIAFEPTAIYVNAPQVGPLVPVEDVPRNYEPRVARNSSVVLQGSVPFHDGLEVVLMADERELARTTTVGDGVWKFDVQLGELPGVSVLRVAELEDDAPGLVLAEFPLESIIIEDDDEKSPGAPLVMGLALLVGLTVFIRRRT